MKLKKLSIYDILFKASNSTLSDVVFESSDTIKEQCDIGLLLGGISMFYRADKAIELYKKGLINKILVSGGVSFFHFNKKKKEAYILEDYLIKKGIDKRSIILEPKSRNTAENIKNSIKILENEYDLSTVKIVLITSDFHLRRSKLLLINNLKRDSNLYFVGVKDHKTDINSWYKTFYGKKTIKQEALLLKYYTNKY